MANVRRFPNSQSLALAAARRFIDLAGNAVEARGQFNVALSGGSTPKAMFALLAEQFIGDVAWDRVHCFWGDERNVPPSHSESNYRMAREALLDHIPLSAANIHRILAELEPKRAATAYQEEIIAHFNPTLGDWPRFDLIFLGMGEDGHTASLFPYTEVLQEDESLVVANYVPQLDSWRITMTVPLINAARHVLFLINGQSKAGSLREVLLGKFRPAQYPAQLIVPVDGTLEWYVDEAAASLLK
jgi:6-phosphogluconolactonase